jgi:opacity protein-like surface antigen
MLAGSVVGAHAADLNGSLKDYAPAMPRHSPASWYLRGDLGYAWHGQPTIKEHTTSEWDLVQTRIEETWSLGAGLGRYFGAHLRGDLTIEHRFKADVRGLNADPTAPIPGERKFDLSSWVGLANVYYDFGNRSHFTPYLGVGMGFAHNKSHRGSIESAGSTIGEIDGKSTTQLAAAFMAGFSHELRSGFHVDAGYRFLYLGKAETGAVRSTIGVPTVIEDPTVTDLHAHELRVGVRYDFSR